MKKLIIILCMFVFLCICLSACGVESTNTNPTEPVTEAPTDKPFEDPKPPEPTNDENDPNGNGVGEGGAENRAYEYANIYDQLSTEFKEIYNNDEELYREFQNYREKHGLREKEMKMVTLIKYFDVPREKFDELNALRLERLIKDGRDISPQNLYNADILYTFDNEIINDYYRLKYRSKYYDVDLMILNLISQEEYQAKAWRNEMQKNWDAGIDEMEIVTLIKYYNIPREAFEKIVEEKRQSNEKLRDEWGVDITGDNYELYNLDIIYTFDNELINEYYRRK